MIKKALVIGSGFLGSHIIKEFQVAGIQTVGTKNKTVKDHDFFIVDVRNISSISDCVLKVKPDLIINCAANVQIDFLEKNPELAYAINSHGAANIAKICQKYKIRMVHISTDGIFDGYKGMYSEEDIPNPINIYAKSKALAEKLVKESVDDCVIVRTNFYGFNQSGKFLFNWVLDTLRQNKQLVGFYDVIFTPLEISNLSRMIFEIAMKNYSGIIHLASNEPISKYQFAINVAESFELNKDLIKRDSVDNHVGYVARRSKNTSLINKKAREILNTPIISLNEWLIKIKETV